MKQEAITKDKHIPFTAVPELTVLKENASVIDNNLYRQILRSFPGGISVLNLATPFGNLPMNKPFNRFIKRGLDIIFSLFVIIGLLTWFIPFMAILIKLDSRGPVFFLQKRGKRNGSIFTCIKFRSMIVNEEADVLPAGKFDKRITAAGKFMRKNYIDELPQFFNVLAGDMSVVGPRPHMLSDNLKYNEAIDYYDYRHNGKPGITGLAQVMGYVGVADDVNKMKDRVNMDNFYLRHWSFKFDLVILFRTFCNALGL